MNATRPRNFYEHGYEDAGAADTYYCAVCEMFMDASHFEGDPLDPVDMEQHPKASHH